MISSYAAAGPLNDAGQITPSIYYPGDNCCWIYEKSALRGTKVLHCHDGSKRIINLGNMNNKISSYYCGKNIWYNFCKDK